MGQVPETAGSNRNLSNPFPTATANAGDEAFIVTMVVGIGRPRSSTTNWNVPLPVGSSGAGALKSMAARFDSGSTGTEIWARSMAIAPASGLADDSDIVYVPAGAPTNALSESARRTAVMSAVSTVGTSEVAIKVSRSTRPRAIVNITSPVTVGATF